MKILFCAPYQVGLSGEVGGVRKEMLLRKASLEALGHEVVFLSPWERPDWSTFDLCHLFMANGDSYSLGVYVKGRLPLIVSPIIDRLRPGFLLRLNLLLERLLPTFYSHLGRCAALCALADVICLRSEAERELLTKGLGLKNKKTIAYCPAIPPRDAGGPGRLAQLVNRPYILFVGDAGNARKNIARLIQAVTGIDVALIVAGAMTPGRTADAVRSLAEKRDNVHLAGMITEAEKLHAQAHAKVFVLPSLMEGIGLSAVEAGLQGTTVVVTKFGGAKDYFGDNAYYIDPFSVPSIRKGILDACVAARNSAERLRTRFNLEATGRQLEACYGEVIQSMR